MGSIDRRAFALGVLISALSLQACPQRESARSTDRSSSEDHSASVEPPPPSSDLLIVKAQKLLEQARYDEAIVTLEPLGTDAGADVVSLRSEARIESTARALLHAACLDTHGADVAAVYYRCRQIKSTSRHHGRGCCAVAAERFGEVSLERAREHLRDEEHEKAHVLARGLVDDERIPEAIRNSARGLLSASKSDDRATKSEALSPWLDQRRRARSEKLPVWIDDEPAPKQKSTKALDLWLE